MGSSRELWRRCQDIVAALPIPRPFRMNALLAALAEDRGRPIELIAVEASSCTPCGMLLSTERADYICYPQATSALHQEHIVLHEVAHILCGPAKA